MCIYGVFSYHVRLTERLMERLELEIFSRSQTIFDEALDPPIASHTPHQPLGNQSISRQQVLRRRSAKPFSRYFREMGSRGKRDPLKSLK